MAASFISGLALAAVGIVLSLLLNDWQIAFVFSAALAGISIILTVLSRNVTMLLGSIAKRYGSNTKSIEEVNRIINIIAAFGSPNVVIAIILYFVVYR